MRQSSVATLELSSVAGTMASSNLQRYCVRSPASRPSPNSRTRVAPAVGPASGLIKLTDGELKYVKPTPLFVYCCELSDTSKGVVRRECGADAQ